MQRDSDTIRGSVALGARISQWGAGGDILAHVGSYFVGGHPVTRAALREALAAMKRVVASQKVGNGVI